MLGVYQGIYSVDLTTGAMTKINSNFVLQGQFFGFDFNPTVDRARVTGFSQQNFRINPNDGAVLDDAILAYAAGDVNFGAVPAVGGSAYTSNFPGAATTTLFDIDANTDVLAIQNPANSGQLSTVGPLGVDTGGLIGFDIDLAGQAWASLTPAGGTTSTFYSVSLTSGAVTAVGAVGGGAALRGLSVAPAGTP